MKTWTWVSAQYNDGRKAEPMRPGDFTVTFDGAGKFSARTDCNSMSGSYTTAANNVISFSQIASTKMFCQGSQEMVFAALLGDATTYSFTSRGELILGLKFDSGTVTFK
jgi:heat shock protein HslJ